MIKQSPNLIGYADKTGKRYKIYRAIDFGMINDEISKAYKKVSGEIAIVMNQRSANVAKRLKFIIECEVKQIQCLDISIN